MNLQEIIKAINPLQVIGNTNRNVSKIIPLDVQNTSSESIMWISSKNMGSINKITEGIIICTHLDQDFDTSSTNCTYLISDNPRLTFQKLLKLFTNVTGKKNEIAKTTYISASAKIGSNVSMGHFVIIEEGCIIGDNCSIDHHTVIKERTILGNNVQIGACTVIGGTGFGYVKNENEEYEHIPHIGNVIIEDNVEIGNNTCIDRAVVGSTHISQNVKIDNLVHIAHGVQIGRNSLVIANAMIAGSTKIGENVWVAPSASLLNGIQIANDAFVGLGSVVIKDVNLAEKVVGNPARILEGNISNLDTK